MATSTNAPAGKEGPELRKPHEMIVMVPRAGRVTLAGRRIYNALLQVSQSRLMAMDGMPHADFLFEAPLSALLRTTGSNGDDRTIAKRYLREMRATQVDWESTAPGDGPKWRDFSMLSEVAIEVRDGQNWVAWSFPPSIIQGLKDPQRWARINLEMLAKLGTYPAVALYEICARYRDNPSGVTSRKPVAWWCDALSPSAAGSERREWRKFKSERVKPAIDEINAETDLEVELIEHKQGRAVMEVQLSVRRRRAGAARLVTGPVDANLILRAESLGVRESKLEALIKEFGEEAVARQVDVLEKRTANAQLRVVDNAASYLRSLLRNNAEDLVDLAQGSPASAPVVERGRAQSVASLVPAPALEAESREAIRHAQLKSEVAQLPPDRRQLFVEKALQDLAEKRQLNAVISRRAAQGDVLHGLLGAAVVRAYATFTYGDM